MGDRVLPPALRKIVPLLLILVCAAAVSPGWATPNVVARANPLRVTHIVLSQVALEPGASGLEVRLIVRNGGTHALHDVRLYIPDPTARSGSGACAPARLPNLAAGTQQEVTWTFECSRQALPREPEREIALRVEAIDAKTQKLVMFRVTSRGGR